MPKLTPNLNEIIPKARVLKKLAKLGLVEEKYFQLIDDNVASLEGFTSPERKYISDMKAAIKENKLYSYLIGTYQPKILTFEEKMQRELNKEKNK